MTIPGIRQEGAKPSAPAIVGTQFRWKNNTIPFQIDPTLPNPQRVLDAIKHWEDNTPIRLVERDAADRRPSRFRRLSVPGRAARPRSAGAAVGRT